MNHWLLTLNMAVVGPGLCLTFVSHFIQLNADDLHNRNI
jgi:hypothetical protein